MVPRRNRMFWSREEESNVCRARIGQPQRTQKDTEAHRAAVRASENDFGGVAKRRARPKSDENTSRLKRVRFVFSSDSAAHSRPAAQAGRQSRQSSVRSESLWLIRARRA